MLFIVILLTFGDFAGKATSVEPEDAETRTRDNEINEKLDQEEYTGILRDIMNQLKGELGTLTNKKGNKAIDQVSSGPSLLVNPPALGEILLSV